MKLLKKAVGYSLSGLFWLGLWLLIASIVNKEVILPAPDIVFKRLFEFAFSPETKKEFWDTVLNSLLRVTVGVFSGIILATVAATLTSKFKVLHYLFSPFNEVVKATPIVSFIFIAYIIFQKSIWWLPVFIVTLLVFPVVYSALTNAIENVDRELLEVSEVFGCTRLEKLRYLWVPSVSGAFITSSYTALGLGWKAGIAAEALASSPSLVSIGTEISEAKTFIETVDQFAWTVAIIIISIIIGILFQALAELFKKKILQ
jgi:NitT/TauT family transport system permease protein